MPVDVVRLRDSDLAAEGDPASNWYAFILWCAAWHQRPAGSLPKADDKLAYLVRLDKRGWKKHRAGALRGWIECLDGRLYHPVVTEKVIDALAVSRAGKRGAAARWSPKTEQVIENTQDAECGGNADCEQAAMPRSDLNGIEQKEDPPIPPGGGSEGESDFDRFWKAYPHRGRHADPMKPAREAFEHAVDSGASVEDILLGARRYSGVVQATRTEPKHVPTAANWLGDEAWQQYVEMPEDPSAPSTDPTRSLWLARLKGYRPEAFWPSSHGPRPGQPNCQIPKSVLIEVGLLKPEPASAA